MAGHLAWLAVLLLYKWGFEGVSFTWSCFHDVAVSKEKKFENVESE